MFKLEIKTGGAAFRSDDYDCNGDSGLDPSCYELRRLIREVDGKLSHGYTSGVLMDINGNKVGSWTLD